PPPLCCFCPYTTLFRSAVLPARHRGIVGVGLQPVVSAAQGSEVAGAGCTAGAIGFPRISMVGVALMCSAGAERECARVVRELNVLAGTSGRLIRMGVDGFLEVEHGADVDLRRESSCERGAGEPFENRSWVADDRPRNSLALYRRDAAGRLRNSRMGQVDEEFDAGRARTFAVPEWTGRGFRGR